MPLLAVTHSEAEVAVSVNYFPEHVAGTPKLDLLVCSAHVWLDQQILERTINHFQRLKKLFDSASGSTTNRFFSFVSSISSVGVYFFPSNTKDVVSLRLEGEEGGSVQSRFQKGIETSDPEPFLDIVQNHEKVLAHLNPTSLELFYCVCSGLNMESYTAHRCVWGYGERDNLMN